MIFRHELHEFSRIKSAEFAESAREKDPKITELKNKMNYLEMMIIYNYSVQFVISTKEKSSQETRQRSAFRNGAACEDFSFVEMTILSKTLLE